MRRLVPVGALLSAIVVVLVVASSGSDGHTLRVEVDQALYIDDGSPVRLAGQPAGEVTDVEVTSRGRARITLRVDEDAWPLPGGTTARLRWLGTIAYGGRYVELIRPRRARGGAVSEGATLAGTDARRPTEIDEVLGSFDASGRRALRNTLTTAGAALDGSERPLAATLRRAPATLEQARAVLEDLGHDPASLERLVATAASTVDAVDAASPGIGSLITDARTTFAATARRARELEGAIGGTPQTLVDARSTLRRADPTLERVNTLTRELRPGLAELRRIDRPLAGLLDRLGAVAPDASATLRTLRTSAPRLNRFLDTSTRAAPLLASVARQATPQVGCVRPYAPEIAGFASTWASFTGPSDGVDRVGRINTPVYPFTNASTLTPKEVTTLFPGVRYAFPHPPGESVGQPWFQPQCGITADALDPAKDPEANG